MAFNPKIQTGIQPTEVFTAARTLTIYESGKTCFLGSATGFALTLPAPSAGLKFTFIVKTQPTSGGHTVVTSGAAEVLGGSIVTSATGAADTEADITGTTVTFVASTAVVGDRVEMISDGVGWYAFGISSIATGITITG
jgi:hypothetical protein